MLGAIMASLIFPVLETVPVFLRAANPTETVAAPTTSGGYQVYLAHDGNVWLATAVNNSTDLQLEVFRSTDDGATWASVYTHPGTNDLTRHIAAGGGNAVIALDDGTTLLSSDGGLTWLPGGALPLTSSVAAITYGAGIFVASAMKPSPGGPTDVTMAVSQDGGAAWAAVVDAPEEAGTVASVTYAAGKWVAAVRGFSVVNIHYSDDAVTWVQSANPIPQSEAINPKSVWYDFDSGVWVIATVDGVWATAGASDPSDPASPWASVPLPATWTIDAGYYISVGGFAVGAGSIVAAFNYDNFEFEFYQTAAYDGTDWGLIYGTNDILAMTESVGFRPPVICNGVPIIGLVQWPHLDFQSLGRQKQFIGFDLVANAPEGVRVSIGYDQRNLAARTPDYGMEADTLPGQLVPIPVSAPSFDMRLTFNANQEWEWQASVIYVQDQRLGS
jgi:hypothetical protein